MISEEFLVYYMWSFVVVCLGASVWITVSRRVKERRQERAAMAAALRRRRPYDWAKEKNI